MEEIISSYPNKHYKSKHKRFKNNVICACECDCDMIVTMIEPPLKKGDKCWCCAESDHAYPAYNIRDWVRIPTT